MGFTNNFVLLEGVEACHGGDVCVCGCGCVLTLVPTLKNYWDGVSFVTAQT
jgi:hypothetical protein